MSIPIEKQIKEVVNAIMEEPNPKIQIWYFVTGYWELKQENERMRKRLQEIDPIYNW